MSIEELQAELAIVLAALERHYRTALTGSETNPAGDIGGIRSRSQRQKNAIFNRYMREATEGVALATQRDNLQRRITILKDMPERERRAHEIAIEKLEWWDGLKPGDTFTPGNAPLVIARKNRKTLITASGSRWTIEEVTGLSVKQLRLCAKPSPPPPGLCHRKRGKSERAHGKEGAK